MKGAWISQAADLRRLLHLDAEPAGREERTAQRIEQFLRSCKPNRILTGLGGCGIVAVFEGDREGPTILLRADMDGLPIPGRFVSEAGTVERTHSHRCGHDGHMAILGGIAKVFQERPPSFGRLYLLFQPSEETGEGAAMVLADRAFQGLDPPDKVFALHNLPGYPTGSVILRDGVFASASRGMSIQLAGTTSHAAEPHKGKSPGLAVSQMIQSLGTVPQLYLGLEEAAKVTVVHVGLGEPEAFGTSPGSGVVQATLRSYDERVMKTLVERCSEMVDRTAMVHDIRATIEWTQVFPATTNDQAAMKILEAAADELGLHKIRPTTPFPWSEDFGHFTDAYPGVLFGLGAGEDHPALHNPKYVFPDALIPTGVSLFETVVRKVLKGDPDV